MKRLVAGIMLAASPLPALAQGLPVFDESLGFEILDTIDDGLVVLNAGQAYYCEIEEGAAERYLVMTGCMPILAPRQAADMARAAAAGARSAEAFVEALENLPPAAFIPQVNEAMREMGCEVNFRVDEDAFVALLADRVAEGAGYTGEMTLDLVDEIGEITEDSAELMIESGQIVLDREAGTARLVECP